MPRECGLYQFDAPRMDESLDQYLRRHHAHPDQPDRREATDEEIAACDKTDECLAQTVILTGINLPNRRAKKHHRR